MGRVAKVNKLPKVEPSPPSPISPPMSQLASRKSPQLSQMSPRLWFKKKQRKEDVGATMPQSLSKAAKSSQNSKNNQVRPVSLLASISDFDREAAKIVEQRHKDEEARKRVNDESFYVSAAEVKRKASDEDAQKALDDIMAKVEQKMECLDAIGKHNQRWEKRMNHVERESIPSIDMNGLVSDLNQFLNTTKKEMMTPKTKRKVQAQKQLEQEFQDEILRAASESENHDKEKKEELREHPQQQQSQKQNQLLRHQQDNQQLLEQIEVQNKLQNNNEVFRKPFSDLLIGSNVAIIFIKR